MKDIMKYKKWVEIPWKSIHIFVYDLQCKIYYHTGNNNKGLIRYYQHKLIKSVEARLLSVRYVSQDNRGKVTAGIDGIAKLTSNQRFRLAQKLTLDGSSSKIRRVFIKKSNGKLRPLGIPTMKDRAKQMLIKLALEPEWEAKFENNSYGFRPGYSAADAKWCVARQLQGKAKFFLDADIQECFDKINHSYLLDKLNTSKMIKHQIASWLKASILNYSFHIEDNSTTETSLAGTPQGGVLSPLLMNITLHGMETFVLKEFSRNSVKLIRYADDFVVFAKSLKDVVKAKDLISKFLYPIGLQLSEEKTRIGHSMISEKGTSGPIGLDFLSFNFKNVPCSHHRGVKNTKGVTQEFRLITKPAQEAVKRHKRSLSNILVKFKSAPLGSVMERLSRCIKGWTWYHSITQCTRTFSKLDEWLFWKLWLWAKKRYKTATLAKKECFSVKGWKFGYTEKGITYVLDRHDNVKIRKFVKITAGASIYDKGKLLYFAKRLSINNPRIKPLINLFKKQNYSCSYCCLTFSYQDIIELHHLLDSKGIRTGKVVFIHGHCHDQIHTAIVSQSVK